MSPPLLPKLGSVVWVELVDANGFRKIRPAVILTPTAQIAPGKVVQVAAITTRLPSPLPEDHVLLPWNAEGKSRTGLRRKCAAVASWLAETPVDDVRHIVGILPPALTHEVLVKVKARIQSPRPPQ